MADDPAHRPRRTPVHGSVVGMWQPPRGEPGEYSTPMPLPHGTPGLHAEPSPLTIPRHGGHVWVRHHDGWVPGLGASQDHVGRRAWCTWLIPGRVDWTRVEGWVSWDDLRSVEPEAGTPPF